jgi:glucose/arabinose dehydrogenase
VRSVAHSIIRMKFGKLAILLFTLTAVAVFVFPRELLVLQGYHADNQKFSVEVVAKGLNHPWGLAFLPDGRMLVSERSGNIRLISTQGEISEPLAGVPRVHHQGQGGLLGVAIDPDFSMNRAVYFSYSEPEGSLSGTAVARAVLMEDGLKDVQVIFRQQPKVKGDGHYGSRLVFAKDGTLFITLGERQHYADQSQLLSSHMGKVVRIHKDGNIPSDNPYSNSKEAKPEIWSYGHRNIQGAALHPATGKLWLHEHGPRGGDEVNIAEATKNYGWPKACYGSHYSGEDIPDAHAPHGYVEPVYHWSPSIAPSGMAFYTGGVFPQWQNSLLVGALAGEYLARLELEGEKVRHEEKLLTGMGKRIRDVVQGPDGLVYLLTDEENGHVLRLVPPAEKEQAR